jgi:hypothetical protein
VLFHSAPLTKRSIQGSLLQRNNEVIILQDVPLATETSISSILLPLLPCVTTTMRTKNTFLFISNTTNVLLFNIFIGVGIIKEML